MQERDAARLLVVDRGRQSIEHLFFRDIGKFFIPGDLLVLNDTKVMPCRLKGSRKSGGKVEVLLLRQKSGMSFSALIKPGRLRVNEEILFAGGRISGVVNSKDQITFNASDAEEVYACGQIPLPPYIKREPQETDLVDYQTVYAKVPGAVASPTAGLHFTRENLKKIVFCGVNLAYVTLHVGHATFAPVKTEDIRQHLMGEERFFISDSAAGTIDQAKLNKNRIFAVGTTSCRCLETFALGKKEGQTNIFIYPGYEFKMVDCLLTNFHLPRTTLFMLACAFGGEELIKRAYQEAVELKYRFYSYGDAMLVI